MIPQLPPDIATMLDGIDARFLARLPLGSKPGESAYVAAFENAPREAGVYLFIFESRVAYVGKTRRGLQKRLKEYLARKKRERTVHVALREIASGGHVEIWTIEPIAGRWGKLTDDGITGLESALIKTFDPPWNRDGKHKELSLESSALDP